MNSIELALKGIVLGALKKSDVLVGKELSLKVQGEDIIYPGTPLEGSTAVGYIMESYISLLLSDKDERIRPAVENSNSSVTNTSYDMFVVDGINKHLINIKVEKNGSTNNAVAAMEQYVSDISSEDLNTYFYILKISYELNTEKKALVITDISLYNVDMTFSVGEKIKSDSRNWSNDFTNDGAGRFQAKNLGELPNNFDLKIAREKLIDISKDLCSKLEVQLKGKDGKAAAKIKTKISFYKSAIASLEAQIKDK